MILTALLLQTHWCFYTDLLLPPPTVKHETMDRIVYHLDFVHVCEILTKQSHSCKRCCVVLLVVKNVLGHGGA